MRPVRVLLTTTGNAGFLLPLVPIARACVRAGHEVCVATQRPRGDGATQLGLPLHAVDEPSEAAWRSIMAATAELPVEPADERLVGELPAWWPEGDSRQRVLEEPAHRDPAGALASAVAALPTAEAAVDLLHASSR